MRYLWTYSLPMHLLPISPSGWVLFALWAFFIVWLIHKTRRNRPKWQRRHWFLFAAFLLSEPLLAGMSIEFATAAARLQLVGMRALMMPLLAVPVVLAAGYLGPGAAAGVGLVAGAIEGLFGTSLIFQPLIWASIGLFLGWGFWQPYKNRLREWLRQPLAGWIFASLLYGLLITIAFFAADGHVLAGNFGMMLRRVQLFVALQTVTLFIGAAIGYALILLRIGEFGYRGYLQIWANGHSLERRFSRLMAGVVAILLVGVLVGNWALAQRSAKRLVIGRLKGMADIAAQSLPFFTENGQITIQQLASDPELLDENTPVLQERLSKAVSQSAFFNRLMLVDPGCTLIASAPESKEVMGDTECKLLVLTLLHGSPVVRLPYAGRVDFAAPVKDKTGKVRRILVGFAKIEDNPYTKPLTDTLSKIESKYGGGAGILSERGGLLFVTDSAFKWLAEAKVPLGESKLTDTKGAHYISYAERAVGSSWKVVVLYPESNLNAIAANNALPLSLIVGLLALVGWGVGRAMVSRITRSLLKLARAADDLAAGELDKSVEVESKDEVGRLGRALERMRVRLRKRIAELNRLLSTSQQVAASLKVDKAADAVLRAALATNASAARIVLSKEAIPDELVDEYPATMGLGARHERYAFLDEPLLELASRQVVFKSFPPHSDLYRAVGEKALLLDRVSAILSVTMYYEQRFLGVLYLVYKKPHSLEEEDIRYVTSLALQMAMATYTARLYATAEVRRQRLRAILDASPDPVLVTDKQNRLILANAAAFANLPLDPSLIDQPVEIALRGTELLSLFKSDRTPPYSEEVAVGDKIYFATVASVDNKGREIGRVCLLRDITHFRELDALKSDFVATVSHDLRAPLTLMRGYLTMLEMVGDLNERQRKYIAHIQRSVDNMARLVSSLLDLGRIEAGVGLQVQMLPLFDLLEEVKKRWEPQASRKQIELRLEIAPRTPPLIEADQALLDRAINNLVENAIKYTPKGGRVTIFTRPKGSDRVVIGVSDTGIGISQIDKPRLFEKFYRVAKKGQTAEHGTGLGLAIVKSVVERHHGKVWVKSKIGEGSTFFIELPLRQPKDES